MPKFNVNSTFDFCFYRTVGSTYTFNVTENKKYIGCFFSILIAIAYQQATFYPWIGILHKIMLIILFLLSIHSPIQCTLYSTCTAKYVHVCIVNVFHIELTFSMHQLNGHFVDLNDFCWVVHCFNVNLLLKPI